MIGDVVAPDLDSLEAVDGQTLAAVGCCSKQLNETLEGLISGRMSPFTMAGNWSAGLTTLLDAGSENYRGGFCS